jgi:tRNA(Glu) U13 pseudouridine synthase TruD
MRWADFHVRERSAEADGAPLALTALPSASGAVAPAEVISFVMCKENRTTADALQQLASASHCPLSAFAVAGSKDRRAITVQQVTARGLRDPSRLLRVNDKWTASGSRVRVGHFGEAPRPLSLSSGRGNHFVVVLREVALRDTHAHGVAPGGGEAAASGEAAAGGGEAAGGGAALRAACEAAAARVRACGFVNYFGLQRFGVTGSTPTHEVGALLLRRQFVRALQLVLRPHAAGLKPAARAALELFGRDASHARQARARLPARGCALPARLLSSYIAALDTPTGGNAAASDAAASDAAASGTSAPEVDDSSARPTARPTDGVAPVEASEAAAVEASEAAAVEVSEASEAAAAVALGALPRRQLLLYVNALQALAFNRAATCRLQTLHPEQPVEGDLVWADGMGTDAAPDALADTEMADEMAEEVEAVTEAAGTATTTTSTAYRSSAHGGASASASTPRRAELPPAVRELTAAEAASGEWSLCDVLLPLPGHAVCYPRQPAVRATYANTLASCGLLSAIASDAPDSCPAATATASECAVADGTSADGEGDVAAARARPNGGELTGHDARLWHHPKLFDLPGCYRPLVAHSTDLRAELVHCAPPRPSNQAAAMSAHREPPRACAARAAHTRARVLSTPCHRLSARPERTA